MYFFKIPFGWITIVLPLVGALFLHLEFFGTGGALIFFSFITFMVFLLTKPFKEYLYKDEISISLRKKILVCDLLFNILIIGVIIYYVTLGHVSEDEVGLLKSYAQTYTYIFYVFILFIIKVTLKFLIKIAFK
jgi:hypothetical protein